MNRRSRIAVVGLAGAISGLAVLGLANAQTSAGERPPRGPFVDFCPTPEQAEAHMQEYGFDYKPTVACTSEGEEVATPGRSGSAQPPPPQQVTAAQMAREKAYMQSLERGPEKDDDPATIEAIGPDGEEVTIFVQTSQPERYRGMTPAEFAEEAYP